MKKKTKSITPGIYRHYKDKYYEVFGSATHTETGEEFVVYKSLYGDFNTWVRPCEMFLEHVEVNNETVPSALSRLKIRADIADNSP